MFLRRLILENVRSIETIDLPLTTPDDEVRKWTFLLGENGTGKSTVLRSAALLLAGSEAMAELLTDIDSWIRHDSESCRIAAELTTADDQLREISLVLERGDNIRTVFERNEKTLRDLDRALAHTERNYLTLGYGVSRRPSEEEQRSTSSRGHRPRARAVATLFSPHAVLNPLQVWAMDLDYRHGAEGLETVRTSLNSLLPEIAFSHIDRDERRLMFETQDGLVPYEHLSDGYRNVIAWVGDLLYQVMEIFDDYRKPLAARGLLLIDELGLHLHPTWQRHLVSFLSERLPNFQIVCTTHSPLTVHQAGAGELFFLRRDETAQGAPRLHHYEDAPNRLLLHQLLTSPIFGLESPDSLPVEEMKKEYRELQQSKARSVQDSRQLQELEEELESVPQWTRGSDEEKRIAELLESLEAKVG